jgi:hypothetical protein
LLGWEPQVVFDDGLRITVDWLRGAIADYTPTVYVV